MNLVLSAHGVLDLQNYGFNPYALPVISTFLSILFIGVYVLLRERNSSVKNSFFLMTLVAAVWLFAFSWMYSAKDESVAAWWARAAYLGVPFIPCAIYNFTAKVLRIYDTKRAFIYFNFLTAILFSILIVKGGALIDGVYHYAWGFYPKYSLASPVYILYFFALIGLSLQLYLIEYRKSQTETHRARIKLLMMGFIVASFASVDYLAKFGLAVYPFGYLGVLGFVVISAYVVTKYRLLDITPSFAAEKIIGAMGDGLLVLDSEDIVRVTNDEACRLFQMAKKDILGKHISDVSPYFPLKNTPESLHKVGEDHGYELRHLVSENNEILLKVSESPMKDNLGCVVANILILRDITDMKQKEIALKETETRFKELYNGISEAVIIVDAFGRFCSINAAAERMLGCSNEKISGRVFVMSSYLPSAYMGKILHVIRNIINDVPESVFDLDLISEEGNLLKLEAHATPVKEKGKTVAVQIMLRSHVPIGSGHPAKPKNG
jgi:PAS domain S-box-containing protein